MANRLKMRILLLLSLVYINCDYLQAQTTIPVSYTHLSGVEEVDLNGQCIERKKIKTRAGKSEMTISMPRFGIKTFVLSLT